MVVVFSNDPVVFSNVCIDIPFFTSDIVDLYVLYFTSQRARGLLVYQSYPRSEDLFPLIFLEKVEGGRRETSMWERDINWLPPTCARTGEWGSNPGTCPLPGIKCGTLWSSSPTGGPWGPKGWHLLLWCTSWCSNHWAHQPGWKHF